MDANCVNKGLFMFDDDDDGDWQIPTHTAYPLLQGCVYVYRRSACVWFDVARPANSTISIAGYKQLSSVTFAGYTDQSW